MRAARPAGRWLGAKERVDSRPPLFQYSFIPETQVTRYLVRRLRAALPELRIAVGRWRPSALADESSQILMDAGASHVASLLIESRNYLGDLLEMPRPPVPDSADAAGLTGPPPSIGRGSP